MKIVLIYAQVNRPYFFPPMGIVYLGTHLRAKGLEVKLIDPTFDADLRACEEQIAAEKPDLFGLSSLTINYNTALQIAALCKKHWPDCPVVIGGPHVTALPEKTMANPYIDYAVVGEGENTLWELVQGLRDKTDPAKILGLGYKKEGQPVFNPERPVIENLDDLPEPDRKLLPTFTKYLGFQTSFPYFMPCGVLIVSRGCPFKCTFCQPMLRKLFGGKVHLRSPQLVIAEIEGLIGDYGVKSIYFADDTFWANPEWAKEVCRLIKDRGINKKVKLLAQTNLATLNEERLKLMCASGFIYLGFGVESGNAIILKEVFQKSHTMTQAREIFAMCKKYSLVTSANFIIGAPQDTHDTIEDSVKLIAELNPDIKDVHYLTPTPGSSLYDEYLAKGYLRYSDWTDPDRYTPDLINISGLEKGDLIKYYRRMDEAYLQPKSLLKAHPLWFPYLWNILTVTGSFRAFLRVFVLQYLMMNSLFFNRLGKRLLAQREKFRKKKVKGQPCAE